MEARAQTARFAGLVVAAAMVATLFPVLPVAPAHAATTRPIFGISSSLGSLDSATRERALASLEQAGCTWTRVGAYWPWVERNGKGNRDWGVMDAYVAAAKRRNMTIVGAVAGYASWANQGGGDWYVPSDVTAFADFTRDTVNRYKADVHMWEIWNEPNGPSFFKPSPNPVLFAKLLRAGYLAVKQADPTAEVVFGGIDRCDQGFLNKVYAALKAYPDAAANNNFFDVLSVHPYADDRAPEVDDPAFIWGTMDRNFAGLPKMKAAMEAQGEPHKHIIVTEMAWTVTDVSWTKGVGEARQAQYLTRAYQMAQDWPWLDAMMWYGYKNWDNSEAPFSMVNTDLSPRPAYEAFKAAAHGGVTVSEPGTTGGGTTGGGTTGEGTTGGTTTGGTTDGTTAGTGGSTGGSTGGTATTRTRLRPRKRVVKAGSTATLVGTVSPNQTGNRVKLQRKIRGRWVTVKTLRLHRGSRTLFRYRTRRGGATWRLVFSGSASGQASRSVAIRVVAR